MTTEEAYKFIDKLVSGDYSPEEQEDFLAYFQSMPLKEAANLLGSCWVELEQHPSDLEILSPDFTDRTMQKIEAAWARQRTAREARVRFLHRMLWRPLKLVAAIVIFFLLWQTLKSVLKAISPQEDAYPSVTFSDGRKVMLNESSIGQLFYNKDLSASYNRNNALIYQAAYPENPYSSEAGTNEISLPARNRLQVSRADGAVVWLNAGSYLRTDLSGQSPDSLHGQAYFNTSPDRKYPVRIKILEHELQHVLGSKFIVSTTRADQADISVLSGAINVRVLDSTLQLKEGQAIRLTGRSLFRISDLPTPVDTSWIHGKFNFAQGTVESAMDQLGRWYGYPVRFENDTDRTQPLGSHGEIGQNLPLEQVLDMLNEHMKIRVVFRKYKGEIVVSRSPQ